MLEEKTKPIFPDAIALPPLKMILVHAKEERMNREAQAAIKNHISKLEEHIEPQTLMKIIEINNVSKIYNEAEIEVRAVNGVTLGFNEAEFAVIVGPSGSGNTTLLNLIGGLDKPTSGEIIIDGTNLSKLKSSQLIDFRMRNIGFVFQAYNLIPVLTAKENVEFIMSLQKWSREERDKRTFEFALVVKRITVRLPLSSTSMSTLSKPLPVIPYLPEATHFPSFWSTDSMMRVRLGSPVALPAPPSH